MASGKVRARLAFRRISLWHIDLVSFEQCKVFNIIVFFTNSMLCLIVAILDVGLITNRILVKNQRGLAGCVRISMSLYP